MATIERRNVDQEFVPDGGRRAQTDLISDAPIGHSLLRTLISRTEPSLKMGYAYSDFRLTVILNHHPLLISLAEYKETHFTDFSDD